MASRTMSPGGALLRASRVFAIPNPLPRPTGDLSSTAVFGSDTQTLPHPIHATITTPQSSLKRGDWGFKRPLPLRSTTRTSTPLIRVNSIDTIEHVTEYASAADHTLNLKKWQEMNVPISTPSATKARDHLYLSGGHQSVFENDIDRIAPNQDGTRNDKEVRWKFDGPWIAGQNEGEFNTYVTKVVRKRKAEFQKFLRAACATALTKEAHQLARENGDDARLTIHTEEVTEAQLRDYVSALRDDRTELYKQIRQFLDLPPSPSAQPGSEDFLGGLTIEQILNSTGSAQPSTIRSEDVIPTVDSPYAESGPPKTHPSAGLSYGRTSSHTFNHPLYGPQMTPSPVQARVVMPKGAATGSFAPALGVGGFVTDLPRGSSSFDTRATKRQTKYSGRDLVQPLLSGILNIEPDKIGGSKAYVQPTGASVDPKGRVVLVVEAAEPQAVAVLEGTVDEIPVQHQRLQRNNTTGFAKPVASSDEGYGLQRFGEPDALSRSEGIGQDSDPLKYLSKLLFEDEKK